VLNPSSLMSILRVPVRPVDDAASVVPLVLTIEGNHIANADGRHSRRQIDVMSDQERASAIEFDDESLVPATIIVIGQHTYDFTTAHYLLPTTPVAINRNGIIAVRQVSGVSAIWIELVPTHNSDNDKERREESVHLVSTFPCTVLHQI
jgi:hypothetical protein